MVARASLASVVHPHAVPRSRCSAFAASILLTFLAPAVVLAQTGMWTYSADSSAGNPERYAVHMLLVPGDNSPFHSRVVWFRGERDGQFNGAEWGWLTGNDGCVSFPGASFVSLGLDTSGVDIFCAANVALPDGRAFIPAGTSPVTGEYGENKTRIYTRGSGSARGSWSNSGPMGDWRWYPSATSVRGRVMVAGGSRHPQHRYFGGLRNGVLPPSPVGDSLYRFAPVPQGAWETSVIPNTIYPVSPPPIRAGHSFLEMSNVTGFGAQVLFGGQSANNVRLNDTWFLSRVDNPTGPDYTYTWFKQALDNPPLSTLPSKRSDHTAVVALNNSMVVYGGLDETGAPLGDVHRLFRSGPNLLWTPMDISGTPPPARCGHTALYDETGSSQRMIVFGGTSAPGQTPTDTRVWQLRWPDPNLPNSATWDTIPRVDLGDGTPAPRYWHTMNRDSVPRTYAPGQSGHVAFMFGGALSATSCSREFWALWIFENGTVGWKRRSFNGTPAPPDARARHSATFDPEQGGGRLYLFGGDSANVAADPHVFVVDPWYWNPTWSQWAEPGYSLSGHSALLDAKGTLSRIPELYDPANPTQPWLALTAAPHYWTATYPLNFAVPGGSGTGGRIITVGQDPQTYWLDLAASGQPPQGWQTLTGLSTGFFAETGVQYRPGRIMVAGGHLNFQVVGTTRTLNALNLNPGASWGTSAPMEPRYFHNLVLLPDGKVLAVGGESTITQENINPIRRPQIWDPDGNQGAGTWTALTDLAEQPTLRGYHSSAILLPDGRVLSGGAEGHSDKYRFNLFCPPYLFKPNSNTDLAARPSITCAPASVTLGRTYTVPVADTAKIRAACLIRSGATTHAFDQNQRYVPLTFVPAANPPRLFVTVRADADTAPPGYYLLFVTGSADRSDVPSIAKWVKVVATPVIDACDAIRPEPITDLLACPATADSIRLTWTAPADDSALALSGAVTQYDLRKSLVPITDANWSQATPVTTGPPGAPGAAEVLTRCCIFGTTWYFRMKSLDDNDHWSALSNLAVAGPNILCDEGFFGGSGGGGGGLRARRSAGALGAQEAAPEAFTENSVLDGAAPGARASDVYRLAAAPAVENGAYAVRLRQAGARTTALDAARLLVVDHAPGASVYHASGGVLQAVRARAVRVTAGDGTDLTALLGVGEYAAAAGETLLVQLRAADDPEAGLPAPFVMEVKGDGAPAGGVRVEASDGAGGWRTVRQVEPRRGYDEFATDAVGSNLVRLAFLGLSRLRFAGRLVPFSEPPRVQWATLQEARSGGLGDLTAALAGSDSMSAVLAGADTVRLHFAVPPAVEGQLRTCFLAVEATRLAPRPAALSQSSVQATSLPPRFVLRQNQPNPFGVTSKIRFELPAGAVVRLEVFDLFGRRVQVLVNRYFPPGRHAAEWDGRDAAGARVEPGVYFYRIEAGPFRDRKKMLVLPP